MWLRFISGGYLVFSLQLVKLTIVLLAFVGQVFASTSLPCLGDSEDSHVTEVFNPTAGFDIDLDVDIDIDIDIEKGISIDVDIDIDIKANPQLFSAEEQTHEQECCSTDCCDSQCTCAGQSCFSSVFLTHYTGIAEQAFRSQHNYPNRFLNKDFWHTSRYRPPILG